LAALPDGNTLREALCHLRECRPAALILPLVSGLGAPAAMTTFIRMRLEINDGLGEIDRSDQLNGLRQIGRIDDDVPGKSDRAFWLLHVADACTISSFGKRQPAGCHDTLSPRAQIDLN
jgi:hypothetical protein